MPDLAEVIRIQSYLRENARQQYETVALPPFTLFFHRADPLKFFNYAIPDEPTGGDLSGVLARLRDEFRQRGRTARFEFFEAFAPGLPAALKVNGFTEEERQWSMLCTPETLREPASVPGLEVTALHVNSPEADLHDFLLAQRQGFDPNSTDLPTQADLQQTRQDMRTGGWQAYLGRVSGEPAGASLFSRPINGVSEIAGVATREPFRRRGIASRLTWLAAREAFARGVGTACLTAADQNAGRVYERIGFTPFSTMLAYIDEATA